MSDTYRHKTLGYYNYLERKLEAEKDFSWRSYATLWHQYHEAPKYGRVHWYNFFGKNPSHWNRMYSTKPARAKERNLLNQIDLDNCEEYFDFPDWKKPYIYYW